MKEFILHISVDTRRTLGGVLVQGFSEDFAYDPIGNRVSATDYDEYGNPRTSLYSANALNQYVSRTVPGWASVRGLAATNAYISVNGNEAFRAGGYYFGSDDFDNSAQSGWAELETYATVNGPTNDFVSAVTNRVFVPQTPETFAYDADGNMIEDGRFRYWWNGENRMVRADEKMPPEGRAAHVVTYSYDHQGRNVEKDGALQIWDEYNIIAENAGTENVTYNTWGLDIDGTMQGAGGVGGLLAVARNGDMSLPAYDANGNITEYVDSQGGVESHTDYSAFGRGLMRNGTKSYSHGFSTKPWCCKSGLVAYQMRKYVPWQGRWMTTDPIGDVSIVTYLFCNNKCSVYDVLGFVEPSSFLDGVKNEEQAKKLIDVAFPNDPKRRKDELRRWQKKALRRRSSQSKLVKYTKKIAVAATRAAKECGGVALITISVILIPSQVGAEPVMINGQPIKEGDWLGFDPTVGN